ncbi:hypothetical protein DB345_15235 [Spartobacteria bacterium LR76]|nr:hypothetical protein DB345_15235 [Spartobacteria bacterium LR76]
MSKDQLPPAEDRLLESDGFDADLFWAKYRSAIIGGVVAVVVIAVGGGFYWLSERNTRINSEKAFAEASTMEGWQTLVAQYPKSQAAADAYFLIAAAQRDGGKIEDSTATYKKFLDTFPKNALTGAARLGIAQNLEQENKLSEALDALRDIQAQDGESYVASFALLEQARILLRQNKLEEARAALNTLTQTYPTTPSAMFGGSILSDVQALIPPPAVTAVVAPQPAAAASATP